MITITDGTNTKIISDEEQRVLETDCVSFLDWIANAVDNKLRKVYERVILQETNLNPKKMTPEEKTDAIKDKPLKSLKKKQEEFEIEIKEKEKKEGQGD